MARSAWIYFWCVVTAATAYSIAAYFVDSSGSSQLPLFLALLLTASLMRIFAIEAPRYRSYEGSTVIFFASIFLLPAWLFVLIVVIAHSVEWLKERWMDSKLLRVWYIQPFNIAKHILSGLVAYSIIHLAGLELISNAVLVALLGTFFYVTINQLLLGTVLFLARGIPFHQAGLLRDGLLIEVPLALTGFMIVMLLQFSPFVASFFLAPVLLIYQGFRLPKIQAEHMDSLELVNQELTTANQSILQLNDELFHTLAKIFDARDPYVGGHAAQVAKYAVAIATEIGLSTDQINIMRQSGYLHDIGKIAIAEAILHKPSRLTEEEFQYVKTHADIGADFIATSQGLRHLAPFIRHHHERWDGRGYPSGLAGDAIPLEARILNLCDSVEAMASDRPYQRAMSVDTIVAEVRNCAGTQFDPTVANAFVRIAEREGTTFIINSARAVTLQHTRNRHLVNDLNVSMLAPLYRADVSELVS